MNKDYQNAVKYIEGIPKFTEKHPLWHVRKFIGYLGEPCRDKKVIHVAGTNGKGSVCAYIQAIIEAEGHRTGLFTSPHLVKLNERIRIQNQDISDPEFVHLFDRVKAVAETMVREQMGHPSYFEFLFGMALCAFEQARVEYVILETGLGGRLDATNIVPHPLVTVITSIGLDHTAILGNTIEEIAAEKAGIIKPGVPVVCDGNNPPAARVIRERCAGLGCVCREISKNAYEIKKNTTKDIAFSFSSAYYEDTAWNLRGGGSYQPMNAVLAITAMEVIAKGQAFAANPVIWAKALQEVRRPGRMEEVLPGVILDGGHNLEAIRAVTETILHLAVPGKQCIILYTAVSDKKYDETAGYLAEHIKADLYVTATLMDRRGVSGETLGEVLRSRTDSNVAVRETVKEAFQFALKQKEPDGVLYCLGSLYLVGEIKELLKRRNKGNVEF